MAKLKRQGSLSHSADAFEKYDLPIYIPSKQKLRYGIHLAYPYEQPLKANPSRDERSAYQTKIKAWVNDNLTNLDGFVFFDEEHRYQIDFPKGW